MPKKTRGKGKSVQVVQEATENLAKNKDELALSPAPIEQSTIENSINSEPTIEPTTEPTVDEFDSLPYIDLLPLNDAELLLKNELKITGRHPMISTSKYDVLYDSKLQEPTKTQAIDISKFHLKESSNALQDLQNSKSQFEYQMNKQLNLEIASKYGPESLKSFNDGFQQIIDNMESRIDFLESEIMNLNGKRKMEQEIGGKKLKSMKLKRQDLNLQIIQVRFAIKELEQKLGTNVQ